MIELFKTIYSFTLEVFNESLKDNILSLGASIAYFTMFSFGPVIVITIALASIFFGEEAIRGNVFNELNSLLGAKAAIQVQALVENAYRSGSSYSATLISIGTFFFGATGVFVELKGALNIIWCVKASPRNGVIQFAIDRFLSFAMVISIGFILLVALIVNTIISAFSEKILYFIPEFSDILLTTSSVFSSLIIPSLLFAMLFKGLPDANVKWRDVWIGAIFTGILFTIGKNIIGFYIGNSEITNTFGAAGSLAALLVWAYYTAQIVLLGAEFTYVYAKRYEPKIEASEYGVKVKRIEKVLKTKKNPEGEI
ncbi:MAG: YihY/virulence factor BrkB family protein [Chitinophagales bacterium]